MTKILGIVNVLKDNVAIVDPNFLEENNLHENGFTPVDSESAATSVWEKV